MCTEAYCSLTLWRTCWNIWLLISKSSMMGRRGKRRNYEQYQWSIFIVYLNLSLSFARYARKVLGFLVFNEKEDYLSHNRGVPKQRPLACWYSLNSLRDFFFLLCTTSILLRTRPICVACLASPKSCLPWRHRHVAWNRRCYVVLDGRWRRP